MTSLVAIVGPTAVGKTTLGLRIANAIDGEIINADSGQFYCGLDIGTAKPSADNLKNVPHHLIDVLEPSETMGLARFIDIASEKIEEITSRERLPILVGGTGQYVFGLLEGWDVPRVRPDLPFRKRLEAEAAEHGVIGLHKQLSILDRESAHRIDPRNIRRVIRAIEVARSGRQASGMPKKKTPKIEALIIGLTAERPDLYERIDQRIDQMLAAGWPNEVQTLLDSGVDVTYPAMKAIGYRELASHLCCGTSLENAIRLIRRSTRRLVRRQYNWFKLRDSRINWIQNYPDEQGATSAAMLLVTSRFDTH